MLVAAEKSFKRGLENETGFRQPGAQYNLNIYFKFLFAIAKKSKCWYTWSGTSNDAGN